MSKNDTYKVCEFTVLTSTVYSLNTRVLIGKHLIRLAIASLCWYVMTTLFNKIDQFTGICKIIKTQKSITNNTKVRYQDVWLY